MSEDVNNVEGTPEGDQTTSPEGDNGQQSNQQTPEGNEGLIKKNQELLKELKTVKAKIKNFESETEKQREKQLTENEEFKTLADERAEKLKSKDSLLRKKELRLLANEFHNQKDIYNFEELFQWNDEQEIINAEEAMKQIKADPKNAHYFKLESADPINPIAPGAPPLYNNKGKLTKEAYLKMTPEQREKNWPQIMQAMERGDIKP